jgi:hypothetical protein
MSEDDSLREARRIEADARDAAKASERRALEIGESILEMQAHRDEVASKIEELQETLQDVQEQTTAAEEELVYKKALLRDIESSLITKGDELEAAHESIVALARERDERLAKVAEEFAGTMRIHHAALTTARAETAEADERKKNLGAELVSLGRIAEGRRAEVEALEARIPALKAKQDELEKLDSLLLQRKLEVQQEEERRAKLAALAADEKNKYDQTYAYRNAEEARVAELLAQLAAREESIATKFKQLREIKEVVDVAVARLVRKEHDESIKAALKETYEINI